MAMIKISVKKRSPLTGEDNTMTLTVDDKRFLKWQMGKMPIMNAMPNLTDDEREFLITGFMPGEYEKFLGPEPV